MRIGTGSRPGAIALVVALALAVMAPTATAQEAAPTDLLISEYVEGSSFNKAVELWNGTADAIDLAGYTLEVYFNGNTMPTLTQSLQGTIAAGDVFVFADEDLAQYADQTTSASLWNGDDGLVVRNGAGDVVDSFGTIGVDPGTAWGSGDTSSLNHTLRRLPSVCTGDTDLTDAFDPATEYQGFANDTFDGLGEHTADCGGTDGPGDLLISEYVEGSSTNKALELFNGTDAPISLGDYVISVYFNGGTTPRDFALSGSVAPGDVFVFADNLLASRADQTTGASLWNGNDPVVLRRGETVIDSIGQVGNSDTFAANTTLRRLPDNCTADTDRSDAVDLSAYEGLPNDTFDGLGQHVSTCGTTGGGGDGPDVAINELRISSGGDSDNTSNFVEVAGTGGASLDGVSLVVLSGEFNPGQVDFSFDLSGQVVPDDGFFHVGQSGADPSPDLAENFDFFGSPSVLLLVTGTAPDAGVDLDADDDGALDAAPWDEVLDSVALVDGDTTTDVSYDAPALGPDGSFTPAHVYRCPDVTGDWLLGGFDLVDADTPGAANDCDGGGGGGDVVDALISAVQGSGASTALPDTTVRIQAVVTSLFEDDDTLDGFFVQEEDDQADGDPATSEGVFVFCRGFCPTDLAVGDLVTVTGDTDEFFGMTQVAPADADGIVVDASGLDLPTATQITLPASGSTEAQATFETTEGMVVTFPGTLAVSEYFELARYGQLVLTADERPYQFTHDNTPSVEGFADFLADLETRRIILDDDNNDQNDAIFGPAADEPYPYPTTSWPQPGLSVDNTVRGGDTVDGLTGVMHWSFAGQRGTDAWRIRPIDGYDYSFDRVNERTAQPADVGGSLTVASFNVLNYFTTIDDGTNTCPAGCRGADSQAEFERQQAKIVAALAEIDADVVGLIEIENNDTAVADLADAVNAVAGAGTYAPLETGMIGTDSIKVGYLYKPATVELVGDFAILDSSVDPRFIDTKNRPALAQTFREVATTGTFTAAVNHLKSKGSDCADVGEDESIVDGQANCSQTRADAAAALADWLASDPTGSGDEDALIIGDLNAYRMEDAIVVLEDADYTDLNEAITGDDAYTYLFDGQLGYLDYAMSNPSLTEQVTGVTQWHINADEVPVLDYNDDVRDATEASFERESGALDVYDPDPYRSSDHDPVVVGLDLDRSTPEYPAWDPTVRYQRGDVVTHDGLTWEATRPNRNKEPGAKRNGPWRLFGVDYSLTVLHNNDGESDLLGDDDGAGSISRFAWLMRTLQRDAVGQRSSTGVPSGVVTVSAGDNFLASPEWQASLDRGVPFYDALALDRIGYDAFTIGNHEFDFGPEVLADFINSFRGNDDIFLSANLDFSEEPSLQALVDAGRIRPSVVIEERGERIGIVGATTPELPEVTSPGDVIIDDDLVTVVQDEVDLLTADGVDKILLSSHLQDIDNELALVTDLRDVDAVIGGGGGEDIADNYPLVATDATGAAVPVVTVPGDYFDVGRLQLHFDDDGEVVAWGGGLVPVTGDLRQDPYVLRRIEEPVEDFLSDLAVTTVATSQVGLNGIRADVRTRETNLGNLMADGMLATGAARADEFGVPTPQVALQNGGGIRNDSIIGPGAISLLDTFDIAPFTNFVAVVPDVTAADLVAAVEHGLEGLPGAAGSFGQWAGLTVTYDPSAPAGSRVVDLVLDDGTVLVDDGTLVSDQAVTLATIDFLAAGNDGYDMFEPYDFTRVGVSYQQSLADFLRQLGTVTSADYADPADIGDRTRIIPLP